MCKSADTGMGFRRISRCFRVEKNEHKPIVVTDNPTATRIPTRRVRLLPLRSSIVAVIGATKAQQKAEINETRTTSTPPKSNPFASATHDRNHPSNKPNPPNPRNLPPIWLAVAKVTMGSPCSKAPRPAARSPARPALPRASPSADTACGTPRRNHTRL